MYVSIGGGICSQGKREKSEKKYKKWKEIEYKPIVRKFLISLLRQYFNCR